MKTETINGVTKVIFGMVSKYGCKHPCYLFHTNDSAYHEFYVHPAYHGNMFLRMSVDNWLKAKGLTIDSMAVTVCNTEGEFKTYLEQTQKVAAV